MILANFFVMFQNIKCNYYHLHLFEKLNFFEHQNFTIVNLFSKTFSLLLDVLKPIELDNTDPSKAYNLNQNFHFLKEL
jgi:hypothetical protein